VAVLVVRSKDSKIKPTYVCKQDDLFCEECFRNIERGEKFSVITTPSKPYKNNCNGCADMRLANEKHARAESD